jgi:hypothetical protein
MEELGAEATKILKCILNRMGDVNRIKLAQTKEEWRAAVTTEMENALVQ